MLAQVALEPLKEELTQVQEVMLFVDPIVKFIIVLFTFLIVLFLSARFAISRILFYFPP